MFIGRQMFLMFFLIMSLTDSNFLSLRMRTCTNELRTGKNLFSNARHFCSSRASGHKNSVVPRYNKSLYDKHLGQTIDFFVPAWNPVFSKLPRKKVVRIIIGRFEQSGLYGRRFKYLTWVVRVTFGSYNQ